MIRLDNMIKHAIPESRYARPSYFIKQHNETNMCVLYKTKQSAVWVRFESPAQPIVDGEIDDVRQAVQIQILNKDKIKSKSCHWGTYPFVPFNRGYTKLIKKDTIEAITFWAR